MKPRTRAAQAAGTAGAREQLVAASRALLGREDEARAIRPESERTSIQGPPRERADE